MASGRNWPSEDTGPLDTERMLTCDDDFAEKAKGFIKKSMDDGKPFFVWVNFTHTHLYTHTKKESLGQAGRWQSPYHDTMIDHGQERGHAARLPRQAGPRRSSARPTTVRTATHGLTAA